MAELTRENGYEYLEDGVYYRMLTADSVELRLQDPGTEIVMERSMIERLLRRMERYRSGTVDWRDTDD